MNVQKVIKKVHPQYLKEVWDQHGGPILLDVRSDEEYKKVYHALPHVHIPLDRLSLRSVEINIENVSDRGAIVLCNSGHKAKLAAELLANQGLKEVYWIEGGLEYCIIAGHEVSSYQESQKMETAPNVLGAKNRWSRWSIEEQVRLMAGVLLMVLSIVSVVANIDIRYAVAVIGVALFLGAITGKCGLLSIVRLAPWNKNRK